MKLSQAEWETKEIMLLLGREAYSKKCLDNVIDANDIIPKWCDYEKFKRGQKYFLDNRYGILASNLHGLVTLLAEPHGLLVLDSTGKSSTPETAKYRYLSTIVHTLSWYEVDLSPESEIVKSFIKIRKMHFNASKNCETTNIGIITQAELVFTTLGFIGLALIRPHHFGIRHDCTEDREAFLHVWAVLLNMLGVEDQYNICLKSIEVVEIIFRVLLRNIFVLYIQIESERFQKMVNALCDGLKSFIPFISYELLMFEVKRTIGIPGYQYGVEMRSIDEVYRQIFTRDEYLEIQNSVEKRHNIKRMEFDGYNSYDGIYLIEKWKNSTEKYTEIKIADKKTINLNDFAKYCGISDVNQLNIKIVKDVEYPKHMNDSEFYRLSKKCQYVENSRLLSYKINANSIGNYFIESVFTLILYRIRQQLRNKNKK